jgi:hypothetical protein
MTTYDISTGNANARTYAVQDAAPPIYKVEKLIDCTVQNLLANDKVKAIKVPAKHAVLKVMTEVVVAEGTTCTGEVGTSSDADGYIDAVNLNATAGTLVTNASGGALTAHEDDIGAVSASADGIYLTVAHNASAAKLKITAIIADLAGLSATLI